MVYAPKTPLYPTPISGIQITDYVLCYSANEFVPRIWLYSEGVNIGQLLFLPDGADLPDDNINQGYNVYYHLQDYENCVDILRNSEVASLKWNGAGGGAENTLFGYNPPVGK